MKDGCPDIKQDDTPDWDVINQDGWTDLPVGVWDVQSKTRGFISSTETI